MRLVQRLLLAPVPVALPSSLAVGDALAGLKAAFPPRSWARTTRLFPPPVNVGEIEGTTVRLRIVDSVRRGMRPELYGELRATGTGSELVGVVRYEPWRRGAYALALSVSAVWSGLVFSKILASWPLGLLVGFTLITLLHLSELQNAPKERARLEREVTCALTRSGTG